MFVQDNAYACDPRIIKFRQDEKRKKEEEKSKRKEAAKQREDEEKRVTTCFKPMFVKQSSILDPWLQPVY